MTAHVTTPYPHGCSHAHAIYQNANAQLDLIPIYYASYELHLQITTLHTQAKLQSTNIWIHLQQQ